MFDRKIALYMTHASKAVFTFSFEFTKLFSIASVIEFCKHLILCFYPSLLKTCIDSGYLATYRERLQSFQSSASRDADEIEQQIEVLDMLKEKLQEDRSPMGLRVRVLDVAIVVA